MRDYDEQDPNKPRPLRRPRKKATSAPESDVPWRHIKDDERDRHRHVC